MNEIFLVSIFLRTCLNEILYKNFKLKKKRKKELNLFIIQNLFIFKNKNLEKLYETVSIN